jgi:hypothetical protein
MDNQEIIQGFIKNIDSTTIGELSNSRNTFKGGGGMGHIELYMNRFLDGGCVAKIIIHAPNQIVKISYVNSDSIAQFRADLYLELIASYIYIGAVVSCDALIDKD